MFDYPGGGHGFLTKEEQKFAECFARTFSVREAARAAGFDPRTAFARASRLLEKDEVRALAAEYAASHRAVKDAADTGDTVDETEESCGSGIADVAENVGEAGMTDGSGVTYAAEFGGLGAAEVGCGASGKGGAGDGTENDRIIREYEKIAFADTSCGDIKVSDKLRALDQYRAMCERRNDGGDIMLVVNYDYGE